MGTLGEHFAIGVQLPDDKAFGFGVVAHHHAPAIEVLDYMPEPDIGTVGDLYSKPAVLDSGELGLGFGLGSHLGPPFSGNAGVVTLLPCAFPYFHINSVHQINRYF